MEKEINIQNKDNNINNENKPKLRPCCACPQTKELRDKCIMEKGEDNCLKFIDNHKICLREQGFLVD